jgi:hypothetical protein
MMPTKATTAISAIILATIGGCIYSACESWWSILIVMVASIGGMVVFLGLWIEHEADELEKKLHILQVVKLKKKWGWRILMLGIVLEVVLGAVIALWEGWNAHEIRKAEQMADWINQPIFAFEAHATIFVKPLEPVEGLESLPKQAGLWNKLRLPNRGNAEPAFLVLGQARELATGAISLKGIYVNSDNVTRSLVLDPSGKRIAICFDIYFDRNSATFSNGTLMPNELNAVQLTLPIRCEVWGGEMRMELDGRTNRVFEIPPQITFVKCVSSVATNGTFAPIDFSPKVRAQNPFPPPDTNTDFLYPRN